MLHVHDMYYAKQRIMLSMATPHVPQTKAQWTVLSITNGACTCKRTASEYTSVHCCVMYWSTFRPYPIRFPFGLIRMELNKNGNFPWPILYVHIHDNSNSETLRKTKGT